MNLKVRDKVRIRKDLKSGRYKNNVFVRKEMLKYAGRVATLKRETSHGSFNLDLDDFDLERWSWYPFMFEEIIANKVPKLEVGMVVHCDTEEKAKIFLDECKKQGFYDSYYDRYTDWEEYGKLTCYRIGHKKVFYGTKECAYANCNVLEFDDLFKEAEENFGTKSAEALLDMARRIYDKPFHPNCKDYKWKISKEEFDKVNIKPKYEVVYEKDNLYYRPNVKKVIRNGQAVIVILVSGQKGVAKCGPHDDFDLQTGYEIAYRRAEIERYKHMIKLHEEGIELLGELND